MDIQIYKNITRETNQPDKSECPQTFISTSTGKRAS